MEKREVIKRVLEGKTPPYVPWSCAFTEEPRKMLQDALGTPDIDKAIDNHIVFLFNSEYNFTSIGDDRFRDYFGVVWDRSIDRDIGVVENPVIPEPTLTDYEFPDPCNPKFFEKIDSRIAQYPDCCRVYDIGFSLYERAWTLRGMENLMMDFINHPDFVHELLDRIADYNIAQVEKALAYDIDGVYFGDDWGQQTGLQMGPALWHEFIFPRLKRMYGKVRDAGKYVFIHSCGKVDELFDDLVSIGLNCFNPFQPEVMDVFALMEQYRGRLAFLGGLSTQKTLPYGSVEDVKDETARLLESGRKGGYIFSPAHAVEGDVSLENIMAFIEMLKEQPGYQANGH